MRGTPSSQQTMSGSPGQRAYSVELTLDATEEAAERIGTGWYWLCSQISKLTSGGEVLLAMPAISSAESAQSTPLRLRWVGIHAATAEEAVVQARSFLERLATFLPALEAPLLDARAYEEGT